MMQNPFNGIESYHYINIFISGDKLFEFPESIQWNWKERKSLGLGYPLQIRFENPFNGIERGLIYEEQVIDKEGLEESIQWNWKTTITQH
jgi:hypothetical protein